MRTAQHPGFRPFSRSCLQKTKLLSLNFLKSQDVGKTLKLSRSQALRRNERSRGRGEMKKRFDRKDGSEERKEKSEEHTGY